MDALPPPLTNSKDEDEELGFRASGHGTTESLLDSASYAFGRDDSETETAEQRAAYEYKRQGGRAGGACQCDTGTTKHGALK